MQVKCAWAAVVAQLVERSLPIPVIRGSNPVIDKLSYWTFICLLSVVLKGDNKEKKEAGNGPFFKKSKKLIITQS